MPVGGSDSGAGSDSGRSGDGSFISDDVANDLPGLDPAVDLTLAYEPFQAVPGRLHGAGAGVGWASDWVMQAEETTEQNVLPDGLSYLDLATAAGRAAGAGYSSAGRALAAMDKGPFGNERTEGDLIGAPGKVLWVSFLVQKASNDDAPVVIQLGRSGIAWVPEEKAPVRVGFFGASSLNAGKRYWSLSVVNADGTGPGPVALSNREVEVGKTTLIVLKLVFGEKSEVSMFVNPTQLMGPPPATPDAAASTAGPLAFRNLVFVPGKNDQMNHASLDEFRIGRTFAAVTPRQRVRIHWAPPPQVMLPADPGPR